MNKENQQATVGEKSFASTAQVVDLLSLIAKWFLAPAVSVDFDHAELIARPAELQPRGLL